ncbi:MAG: molecular chaperone DnaJ [Rectinemataceae bacterium]|nr:molecular chaperone DnaJ [Rectinemataceae bacterium]
MNGPAQSKDPDVAKRDYYEVLGVTKDSAKDDIKKAYRKLAILNHPDKNPGDKAAEERFKEATEAYEVLGDDQKRQAYDQFGFAGVEGMGGHGAQDFSSVFQGFEDIFGSGNGFGDFSGILNSFFGGGGSGGSGRSRDRVARGSNLRYDLELPFEKAVFGTSIEIGYSKEDSCKTCGGSGSSDGSGRKTCPTCQGAGQVRRSSGFFSVAQTCPSCRGEGAIIEKPCRECSGSGLTKKKQKIKVTIPAGVEDGRRVNIPGQGDAGPNGGPSGDLFVFIHVQAHEYFERQGNDLYCAVPVSIATASLGGDISVQNIEGSRITVPVPAGTQNGKLIRVRDQGVPVSGTRRGDMYIKVMVQVPQRLSRRGRELLDEFRKTEGENAEPMLVKLADIKNQ